MTVDGGGQMQRKKKGEEGTYGCGGSPRTRSEERRSRRWSDGGDQASARLAGDGEEMDEFRRHTSPRHLRLHEEEEERMAEL